MANDPLLYEKVFGRPGKPHSRMSAVFAGAGTARVMRISDMERSFAASSFFRRYQAKGIVAAAALVGMAAGGQGCSHHDPNKPLTEEEGQALVESVRKHSPKPDDLTPAEKSYLKDYLATHK